MGDGERMKKILIVGAGFLQVPLIKKAKECGLYTIAVDGDQNAPGFFYADEWECIDITDETQCLEYAKEKEINGVITAATDYGISVSYTHLTLPTILLV